MGVYYKDYGKHINKLCGQNIDFFVVVGAGGTDSNCGLSSGLQMLSHGLTQQYFVQTNEQLCSNGAYII